MVRGPDAIMICIALHQRHFFRGQRKRTLNARACIEDGRRIGLVGDYAVRIYIEDQFPAVSPALDEGDELSSRLGTQHIFKQPDIKIIFEFLPEFMLHIVEHAESVAAYRGSIFCNALPDLVLSSVSKPEHRLAELLHKFVVPRQDGKITLLHLSGWIHAQGGVADEDRSRNFSIHRFQQIEGAVPEGEDCAFALHPESGNRNYFLADANVAQLHVCGLIVGRSSRRLWGELSAFFQLLRLGQSSGNNEYQKSGEKAFH